MKLHLSLLSLVTALSTTAAAPSRTARIYKRQGTTTPPGFVRSANGQFEVDGKPFYFVGTNAYWLHQLNTLDDITKTMTDIAARKIKVIRTWGFNDVVGTPPSKGAYFQLWQNGTATINEGPNGLQRMDHIMKVAEQLGIYIQFVLTNNWTPVRPEDSKRARGVASNDYGGIDTYVQQIIPGGTHDDFFTDARIKDAYKKYLRAVIPRYKDSKALFSWELVNDVRCKAADGHTTSGNCNPQMITKFTAEVSQFIKTELDPNHMASSGAGGFYCLDCPKLYATSVPPPATSPVPQKAKRNPKHVPLWKRIKKNGPWTKRAMLAKRVEDEKARAAAARRTAPTGTLARIRGRWAAPDVYHYKFRHKRQDGSDTNFGPTFDGSQGVDSDDLLSVPSVDFGSFQFFPDQNTYSQDSDTSLTSTIEEGINLIQAQAESSNTYSKPTTLSGIGLVADNNANSFTPFSSSSSSPDTQQSYATDAEQEQAYTSLFDAAVDNEINGITQYSWGQTGLTSVQGSAVDDTNTSQATDSTNGYSPDDGYAAYSGSLKDLLQSVAQTIEQKYGTDSG